jgi:hypothetical protein
MHRNLLVAGSAVVACVGLLGCEGKSAPGGTTATSGPGGAGGTTAGVDDVPGYCERFPEDGDYCGDAAAGLDIQQAFQLALQHPTVQNGEYLVAFRAEGISPDGGPLAEDQDWYFVFARPGDAEQQVLRVWPDRVGPYVGQYPWQCAATDEIGVDGFPEQVHAATSAFQRENGAVYTPGRFWITGTRFGACASDTGEEVTRIGSRSGERINIEHEMEFTPQHPEGTPCTGPSLITCMDQP